MHVSRALGGVTVLQKGSEDIICTNTGKASEQQAKLNKIEEGESAEERVVVDVPGGLKRCGGQGDILSGAVGTMMAWGKCFEDGAFGYGSYASRFAVAGLELLLRDGSIPPSRIPLLAAVGGSMITRTASRRAFNQLGRGNIVLLLYLSSAFSHEDHRCCYSRHAPRTRQRVCRCLWRR